MEVDLRACSPIGARVCRHRNALNICAVTPNGSDSSIHVQSISWSITSLIWLKSKLRYIQYNMAPPKMSEKAILRKSLAVFLNSILLLCPTKVMQTEWNTKQNTKFFHFSTTCLLEFRYFFLPLHANNQLSTNISQNGRLSGGKLSTIRVRIRP